MRVYFRCLVISILMLWPGLAIGSDFSPDIILNSLKERYPKGRVLKAEYVRITTTKIGSFVGTDQAEKASGILYFLSPNRLRLEQAEPERELLISDGEKIYWHLLTKQEVHRYDFRSQGTLVRAIADIFQGMEETQQFFNMEAQKTEDGYRIKFIPKEPRDDFVEVAALLDTKFHVTAIQIKNLAGGTTIFRFERQEFLPNNPEGLFSFEIPNGVKIIDEDPLSR